MMQFQSCIIYKISSEDVHIVSNGFVSLGNNIVIDQLDGMKISHDALRKETLLIDI